MNIGDGAVCLSEDITLNLPLSRFRVISRKSTVFLFVSMVRLRSCDLKIAHKYFLLFLT